MSSPIVVRALEAGKILDALVAELLFGYEWRVSDGTGRRCIFPPDRHPDWMAQLAIGDEALVGDWDGHDWTPRYSADIAAAFLVVEQMNNRCCDLTIQKAGGMWYVDFIVGDGQGETLPLAICRAALDALDRTTNLFGEVVPAGRCAP